jgi:hypothetical protein
MTEYERQAHDTQHENEPGSAFLGHSLAAAAICLGTAAAIALIAILG